jgi:TrmH RNA methyltransferase
VYGYRAVLALVARRPEDIVEIHAQGDLVPRLSELASWARSRGVPLREPGERELLKLTGTSNHEGLCALTRPRRWLSPGEFAEQLVRARGAAIALDRVRNPYNIGAILRSAAFFGLDGALLGAPAPHPALAQDAVRVAEGGAEHLRLSRTTDLADTLGRLRARGVQVIGAESDGGAGLAGYPFRRPTLVVLGNEREGLGDRIRAQCDALVRIDGSGAIGSLNVSIAASLMIAELVRPAGKSV